MKEGRAAALEERRRASAPQRATSPPPVSAERRHTIENSAALARWTIAGVGGPGPPSRLASPRRKSGRFEQDDESST